MTEKTKLSAEEKRTVLAIDDDLLNQEIITAILEDEYTVICASNGAEGLEILNGKANGKADDISIILLDLNMPVCNGYQFLEKRKASEKLSDIPVVVITSDGSEETEIKSLRLGSVDFVVKPFNADVIKNRIRNIIELRESLSETAEVRYGGSSGFMSIDSFFDRADEMLGNADGRTYDVALIDLVSLKNYCHYFGERRGDFILAAISDYLNEMKDFVLSARKGEYFFVFTPSERADEVYGRIDKINGVIFRITDITFKINLVINKKITGENSIQFHCSNMMIIADNHHNDYNNNTIIYNDDMRVQIEECRHIDSLFSSALDSELVELYFQPKIDAKTGVINSAEALARWAKDDGTYFMPGKFIPILEDSGNIRLLDEYMFRKVCRYQSERINEGKKVVPVSVNISGHSICRRNTVDNFIKIIDEYGIPRNLVCLELTESSVSDSVSAEVADMFIKEGFSIHLDDFGAGYSSLSSLACLSVSAIKLDKTIIDAIRDNKGRIITKSVIRTAHDIGLKVVAEGVETISQLEFLRNAGCDVIQGFFFYSPQCIEEFDRLIDKHEVTGK